jgi:hypothetical protein
MGLSTHGEERSLTALDGGDAEAAEECTAGALEGGAVAPGRPGAGGVRRSPRPGRREMGLSSVLGLQFFWGLKGLFGLPWPIQPR